MGRGGRGHFTMTSGWWYFNVVYENVGLVLASSGHVYLTRSPADCIHKQNKGTDTRNKLNSNVLFTSGL